MATWQGQCRSGTQLDPDVEGIENYLSRMLLKRDTSELREASANRLTSLLQEKTCPQCHGKRLNRMALASKINGYTIADLTAKEASGDFAWDQEFNF